MAATQALREVLSTGIAAGDITQITAHVLPPHLKMIDHGVKPGDRASFLTSLPYQLALAALSPTEMAGLDQAVGVPLPALQSFMAKITVAGDEALLRDYPTVWPAQIVVRTASGRREHRIEAIPGDPARPLTAEDVSRKFQHFVAPVCGDDTSRLHQSSATALQSQTTIAALMRELAGIMARAAA
jgi:2-methylcitrate dehydratase PrpD